MVNLVGLSVAVVAGAGFILGIIVAALFEPLPLLAGAFGGLAIGAVAGLMISASFLR